MSFSRRKVRLIDVPIPIQSSDYIGRCPIQTVDVKFRYLYWSIVLVNFKFRYVCHPKRRSICRSDSLIDSILSALKFVSADCIALLWVMMYRFTDQKMFCWDHFFHCVLWILKTNTQKRHWAETSKVLRTFSKNALIAYR